MNLDGCIVLNEHWTLAILCYTLLESPNLSGSYELKFVKIGLAVPKLYLFKLEHLSSMGLTK